MNELQQQAHRYGKQAARELKSAAVSLAVLATLNKDASPLITQLNALQAQLAGLLAKNKRVVVGSQGTQLSPQLGAPEI